MLLKWENGYTETRAFGTYMNGVHRDNNRPIEIVVSPEELFSLPHDRVKIAEYIYTELLGSVENVRIDHARSL